jgi:hypothetical protein
MVKNRYHKRRDKESNYGFDKLPNTSQFQIEMCRYVARTSGQTFQEMSENYVQTGMTLFNN